VPSPPRRDDPVVDGRLADDERRDEVQVGVTGGLNGLAKEFETLEERKARYVSAPVGQDVEGVEPQVGLMAVLDEAGVFGAGGEDRHGGLQGMGRDRFAGVDLEGGADKFAVQDTTGQGGEAGGQVGKIGLELREAVGDFGDRAAGDPDAVRLDVKQGPDAVEFGLDAPGVLILLDGRRLGGVEVVPRAQQHGHDMGRQVVSRMLLPPEMVAEGEDVGLPAGPPVRRRSDTTRRTLGFEFRQGLHDRRPPGRWPRMSLFADRCTQAIVGRSGTCGRPLPIGSTDDCDYVCSRVPEPTLGPFEGPVEVEDGVLTRIQ
jgi:hypothetical protein